jgi:fructose-1,6-bisphosphatase/inositol monophosphatase family enzyme
MNSNKISSNTEFVFPVTSKIKSLGTKDRLYVNGKTISKTDLLGAMFAASKMAWQKAIQPKMAAIRKGSINKESLKGGGVDFFTKADTESEKTIKQELLKRFEKNTFRIFGEEENKYVGNLNSEISIRIDPIDGTECFKFGEPGWSIMIGVYVGKDSQEKEILATVYHPEVYNEIIYYIDGLGIFITNIITGETKEIKKLDEQNSVDDVIIMFWKHTNIHKRGKIDEIIKKLEYTGARVRGISPTQVRESLLTGGKRIMIMDGDYNQVDFISYSMLVKLGYKIFDWNGKEYNIDDPTLNDKKVVLIPPGKVGKKVLRIIKNIQN